MIQDVLPKPQGMAPIRDNDFFAAALEALKLYLHDEARPSPGRVWSLQDSCPECIEFG